MELDFPITIYWDLPGGQADKDFILRICDDIIVCRPLMLQVSEPARLLRDCTIAMLEKLMGGPISVTITVNLDYRREDLAQLQALMPKELLIGVDRIDQIKSISDFLRPGFSISYNITPENWSELPSLVTLSRELGIKRLVFPMQRLYGGGTPFHLSRAEQELLADSLAFVGGASGLVTTIHDPFIWRAFNPGVTFPQAGCQAANTMMAIAPDGAVYPCPALPVRIGTIEKSPLKEIIGSQAKKEFRRGLLEYPSECHGCAELGECRGGCRGRSCAMHGSMDRLDPACK